MLIMFKIKGYFYNKLNFLEKIKLKILSISAYKLKFTESIYKNLIFSNWSINVQALYNYQVRPEKFKPFLKL